MRIAVSVLAILFALLHIIAAATQFKSKDPAARGFAVAMTCGGISAIGAAISHLAGGMAGDIGALSIAYLLICLAAYMNGRRAGNVHVSHHLVRGGIAVLLVLGLFSLVKRFKRSERERPAGARTQGQSPAPRSLDWPVVRASTGRFPPVAKEPLI